MPSAVGIPVLQGREDVNHLLSREPGEGFSCAWAAPEEPEHCYWPGFVLPEKEESDEGAGKLSISP